jgi:hypothetical protein
MEKTITDEQLIGLLEGKQDKVLEQSIESNPELKKRFEELKEVMDAIESAGEVEVPSHIGMNFQEAIAAEKSKQNGGFTYMQIAAAVAILIIGFGLGKFSGGAVDSTVELADLRSEIQSLKEVTLTNTLQRHSASERIMAVNRIEESNQINPELISALISTLNSDESQSVRYASLQALKRFIDNDDVRAELVKSLESQTDPLIQISLITFLVEAEERSAIAPLQKMMKDQEITPEVKRQADIAIQVLT